MARRKLRERLRRSFGSVPERDYLSGDMDSIRTYYEYRRRHKLDSFYVDEITWSDLDMTRVFKRINPRRCTSGEQYLYYMLRSPAMDEGEYRRRRDLLRLAESDEKRRLDMEVILARLGCTRRADMSRIFDPSQHRPGALIKYLALLLLLIISAGAAALGLMPAVFAAVVMVTVNALVHETGRRKCQRDFDTVNYTVGMAFALRRLKRLGDRELDAQLAPAYESLQRLKSVFRVGGLATPGDNVGLYEFIASITLIDLISYEYLKVKLDRNREDVFAIHEHLGRLDAAISIASYRRSAEFYCEPELDFAAAAPGELKVRGLVHPLLRGAVGNDLPLTSPMLITGSNASGKSTYLKAAAIAAIMAQGVCTVTARSYTGGVFRVYTSMAVSDDLLAGESYFMVEIKSLKRILDAAARDARPLLCAVDEILRGTNTLERIAASSEVLAELAKMGVRCVAATHDGELCDILSGAYALYHFEERLGEEDMTFDYKLRLGGATSRNAIDLLGLMGFDEEIVSRAHARADGYAKSGRWT